MNLSDVLGTLARRWYVVVAIVVLAGAAGFGVLTVVPPSYQATSSTVLLPPKGGVSETTNPYLALGDLDGAVDVVVGSLNTESTRDEYAQQYPSAQFTVMRDPTASAPFVVVTVDAPDSSTAMRVMESLTDLVPTRLQELQRSADVQRSSYIVASTVAQDDEPEAVQQTRIRLAAVGAMLTGALGLALLMLLDRRRGRGPTSKRSDGRRAAPAPARKPPPRARREDPSERTRPAAESGRSSATEDASSGAPRR